MNKRSPKFHSRRAMQIHRLLFCLLLLLGKPAFLSARQAGGAAQQLQQSVQQGQRGAAATGAHPGAGSEATIAPEGIANLKLSPGSMVDVHVFEEPDIDGSYRLDSAGEITMPLGGRIPLASLTLPEAEAAIGAKLVAEEVLKTAHVVVNIDEYNAENVVVIGEVATPGRYPILTAHKLKDILAMSGGLTAIAGNEIVLHRANQPTGVTEAIHDNGGLSDPIAMDVDINPGDSVLVKKAGIVYVLGAVNRPGGYVMQEHGELNLAEALALAMGTTPQASTNKTRIIRKGPDGTLLEISSLYDKVTKGEVAPLVLHPEDIVFVPTSGVKATVSLIQSELNAAATATIYRY
ncbi:MAG: SLBB domain-containing protein [Terracidiphilus sp.]|nr:SLBB domain-containing protein [Terracidiphilus sp.]